MRIIGTLSARLAVLLLAAGCLWADVIEQGPKDSKPSGLLAGVARADISPPVGIAHLNWGSQTHIAAVGIDPAGMVATALVLSDGRQKFAIVDVDILSVRGLEEAVLRASKATGIPAAHIRLNATHTHSGPAFQESKGPVGKDPAQYVPVINDYNKVLITKIAGAVIEADAKLRPVHAYAARGAGTINANRRVRAAGGKPPAVGTNPDGFVDRELVVLRIDDAEGRPYAILVNFQCHGTVLTFENKLISPDWIGMVRKTIEQAFPGALALYLQGAAGNQGPLEGGTGDVRVAHRLGSLLGLQAAALSMGIETTRREMKVEGYIESTAFAVNERWRVHGPRDATLKFVSRTLDLPRRTYSPAEIDQMATRVAHAKKQLADAAQRGDAWQKYQAEARLRRDSDLLANWSATPNPSPVRVDVQILRIGDTAIVAMPGEPFAEIGAAVKKASPFAFTMFCGYSTGTGEGYMPIGSEFAHSGYEVEMTPYGTQAADKLIRETTALFKQVQ
jgi:hypothetical protein